MKPEEAYGDLASKIGKVANREMSLENWGEVCSLMVKGARVASIAKEEENSRGQQLESAGSGPEKTSFLVGELLNICK